MNWWMTRPRRCSLLSAGTGRTARLPSLLLPKTSTPAMKPHLTTLEKYTMQTIEIGYAFKNNPENQYTIDALA